MTPPAGVVLAGGASRRMGRDKATLGWGGETLVARAVRLLGGVADPVVVADGGRGTAPAGVRAVPDGPGDGPAAGILGAAAALPGRDLLVLACDLPEVPAALLAALARGDGDWVVPRWERGLEPLCALYRPAAVAALRRRVTRGELDLRGLAGEAGLHVEALQGADLAAFGAPRQAFRNLNTPQDLRPPEGG